MLSKPAANSWSESNSASLHQTQGASQSRELADIQASLSLLQQHVEAEEEGTVSMYLSEVIFRPVAGLSLDSQAEELMGAMAVLHLDRLRDLPTDEAAARRAAEGGG
uniref:hypothetical protein n=1 Tax=uncultured Micrococcus sp. TaxID=114051 RepID=UPI0026210668